MDPWNSANLKVLKIKLNYALFHPPTVMPWLVNKPNRKISLSLSLNLVLLSSSKQSKMLKMIAVAGDQLWTIWPYASEKKISTR